MARLITRDALFEPVRDWWEIHWMWRTDRELAKSDAELKFNAYAGGQRLPDRIGALREEMHKRALTEPAVPWRASRARREAVRPWSRRVAKVDWLDAQGDVLGCRDCLPVYPLGVLTVLTLGWAFGFSPETALALTSTVDVPTSFAWFVVLFEVPMALRWLYQLVDEAVAG